KGISINESVDGISKDASGEYFYFDIPQSLAGQNVYIDAIVSPKTVVLEVVTNIADAGSITINGVDVTNIRKTYSYDETLNITVATNTRYNLTKVVFNGKETTLQDILVLVLNESNGLKTSENNQVNKIELTFERLYWIDVYKKFAGDGTEEAPFLIADAEGLAYMAYIINSGALDQSIRRFYFKVMADIDLTERFWIPIGTKENPFAGTFDLGDFKITGVNFAEVYSVLSWGEYCYGVFGYITSEAKIMLSRSMLPTIILIVGISLFVIILTIIIIIVITNKKKKVKKLSENLGISNIHTPTESVDDKVVEEVTITEETSQTDSEVQEILNKVNSQALNNANKINSATNVSEEIKPNIKAEGDTKNVVKPQPSKPGMVKPIPPKPGPVKPNMVKPKPIGTNENKPKPNINKPNGNN
ncbi:MAG: hypothetical protein IJW25_03150, partial [Clostridia bacterium]|nr:hypothetical protein [Clostridia bacterium]